MLKPQDILVALKLFVLHEGAKLHSFASIANSVGLSASETHAAVKRASRSRLLTSMNSLGSRRSCLPQASASHLLRFVENGLPYVFPAEKGTVISGMPTGVGAEPLRDAMVVGQDELLPVWPSKTGDCKGISFKPLYRSCPYAAGNDPRLYRLLALIDAIRDDGLRQRQVALDLFKHEIHAVTSAHRQLSPA